MKLPYGEFVVDPSRDAVLFAGGTGVTAFTAFLQSLEAGRAPRVLLFYGARTPELFVYGAAGRGVRAARCRRSPAASSREASDGVLDVEPAWPAIETLRAPVFYLSGPPQMLAALSAQLRERGVPDERIRTDAWE